MNAVMAFVGMILSSLLIFFVVLPVVTFLHELGHAAVALALTDRPVSLRVGRLPPLWQGRIGRLTLRFRPITFGFGSVEVHQAQTVSQRTLGWVALGGPAASVLMLLAGIGALPLLRPAPPFWFYLGVSVVAVLALQVLVSIIPARYPWWDGQSDIRLAWRRFRGR